MWVSFAFLVRRVYGEESSPVIKTWLTSISEPSIDWLFEFRTIAAPELEALTCIFWIRLAQKVYSTWLSLEESSSLKRAAI